MNSPSAILDPNSPSGKVCIASYLGSSKGGYYAVFIVDLAADVGGDAGDYVLTSPTFLIDSGSMGIRGEDYVICVLKSTVYLFQEGHRAFDSLPRRGKSAYSYNLYPHLIAGGEKDGKVLDATALRRLPDMISPKLCTVAIPTPDAKRILVFSTMFFYSPTCRFDPDPIDFELYTHPKNKKKNPWKGLPSLQVFLRSNGVPSVDFSITSFGFITNSVFLIQTNKLGIFTLDVDKEDYSRGWMKRDSYAGSPHIPFSNGWRNMDSYAGSPRIPFSGRFFVNEGDKLCIAMHSSGGAYGSGAYDISKKCSDAFDGSKSFCFPLLYFAVGCMNRERLFFDSHIIYGEGEEEGGKLFGIVRLLMGVNDNTESAHMRLDVCRFDLDKYRDDKKNVAVGANAQLETSLVKSFKFLLKESECYYFRPLCLLPLLPFRKDTN